MANASLHRSHAHASSPLCRYYSRPAPRFAPPAPRCSPDPGRTGPRGIHPALPRGRVPAGTGHGSGVQLRDGASVAAGWDGPRGELCASLRQEAAARPGPEAARDHRPDESAAGAGSHVDVGPTGPGGCPSHPAQCPAMPQVSAGHGGDLATYPVHTAAPAGCAAGGAVTGRATGGKKSPGVGLSSSSAWTPWALPWPCP